MYASGQGEEASNLDRYVLKCQEMHNYGVKTVNRDILYSLLSSKKCFGSLSLDVNYSCTIRVLVAETAVVWALVVCLGKKYWTRYERIR